MVYLQQGAEFVYFTYADLIIFNSMRVYGFLLRCTQEQHSPNAPRNVLRFLDRFLVALDSIMYLHICELRFLLFFFSLVADNCISIYWTFVLAKTMLHIIGHSFPGLFSRKDRIF